LTALPFSASGIATCVIAVVGVAPCQCFSPGGNQTTLPGRISFETILSTILAKAVQLSGTQAGTIYTFDETTQKFELRSTYGMDDTLIAAIRERHPHRR
jgi:hypothetical protein